MIRKKTWTEFDRDYSELTQWPLELAYKMYSEIIDNLNELQEERNEVANDISTTDGDDTE